MSEREGQFTEAVKHHDVMESLMQHEGWKILLANIDYQIEYRSRELDKPLESMDKMPLQENVKGERRAFRFIAKLPEYIRDSEKAVIEAIELEKDTEDGGNEKDD